MRYCHIFYYFQDLKPKSRVFPGRLTSGGSISNNRLLFSQLISRNFSGGRDETVMKENKVVILQSPPLGKTLKSGTRINLGSGVQI